MYDIGCFDDITTDAKLKDLTKDDIKKCIYEIKDAQSASESDSHIFN